MCTGMKGSPGRCPAGAVDEFHGCLVDEVVSEDAEGEVVVWHSDGSLAGRPDAALAVGGSIGAPDSHTQSPDPAGDVVRDDLHAHGHDDLTGRHGFPKISLVSRSRSLPEAAETHFAGHRDRCTLTGC